MCMQAVVYLQMAWLLRMLLPDEGSAVRPPWHWLTWGAWPGSTARRGAHVAQALAAAAAAAPAPASAPGLTPGSVSSMTEAKLDKPAAGADSDDSEGSTAPERPAGHCAVQQDADVLEEEAAVQLVAQQYAAACSAVQRTAGPPQRMLSWLQAAVQCCGLHGRAAGHSPGALVQTQGSPPHDAPSAHACAPVHADSASSYPPGPDPGPGPGPHHASGGGAEGAVAPAWEQGVYIFGMRKVYCTRGLTLRWMLSAPAVAWRALAKQLRGTAGQRRAHGSAAEPIAQPLGTSTSPGAAAAPDGQSTAGSVAGPSPQPIKQATAPVASSLASTDTTAGAGTGSGSEGFVAVEGTWLHLAPGACMCVLGPNGAGKTTTLKCLIGVSSADALQRKDGWRVDVQRLF